MISPRYKRAVMLHTIKCLSSSKTVSSRDRNRGSSAPPSHRGPGAIRQRCVSPVRGQEGHRDDALGQETDRVPCPITMWT